MTDSQLIGTWHLLSFETRLEDGRSILPYGPNPGGRITYTDTEYMSVHLWDPSRHLPEAPEETDPAYFSYCGDWTYHDGTVRHHVHAATEAGWTGTVQARLVAWEGARLRLTAEDVIFDGKQGRATLLWEKST